MTLCGTYWPAEPVVWAAFVVASFVFLLPVVIPWRFVAAALLAVFTVLLGSMLIDSLDQMFSRGGHRNICDPPYFAAEALKVTLTSLWALVVAAAAILSAPDKRAAIGFKPKLVALSTFYAVSVLPALFLMFL